MHIYLLHFLQWSLWQNICLYITAPFQSQPTEYKYLSVRQAGHGRPYIMYPTGRQATSVHIKLQNTSHNTAYSAANCYHFLWPKLKEKKSIKSLNKNNWMGKRWVIWEVSGNKRKLQDNNLSETNIRNMKNLCTSAICSLFLLRWQKQAAYLLGLTQLLWAESNMQTALLIRKYTTLDEIFWATMSNLWVSI